MGLENIKGPKLSLKSIHFIIFYGSANVHFTFDFTFEDIMSSKQNARDMQSAADKDCFAAAGAKKASSEYQAETAHAGQGDKIIASAMQSGADKGIHEAQIQKDAASRAQSHADKAN